MFPGVQNGTHYIKPAGSQQLCFVSCETNVYPPLSAVQSYLRSSGCWAAGKSGVCKASAGTSRHLSPGASSLPGPGFSQGQDNDWRDVFFLKVTPFHFFFSLALSFLPFLLHLPFLLSPFLLLSLRIFCFFLWPPSFLPPPSLPLPSPTPLFDALKPVALSLHFNNVNNFCFLDETHKMNKKTPLST